RVERYAAQIGRILRNDPRADDMDVRARGVERRPCGEPRERVAIAGAAIRGGSLIDDQQGPHLGSLGQHRALRDDADDDARHPVDHERAADDRVVTAEPSAPERLGEHDDVGMPFGAVGRRKDAAEHRAYAEDVEETGADASAREQLAALIAAQDGPPPGDEGEAGERVRRSLHARNVAGGQLPAGGTVAIGGLADVHESRRVRDVEVHLGERALDPEHRRRRAYAQRESHDRRDGKGAACGKLAPSVTHVFANGVEHCASSLSRHEWANSPPANTLHPATVPELFQSTEQTPNAHSGFAVANNGMATESGVAANAASSCSAHVWSFGGV